MAILYVGIDLAKNVFAVHGVNEAGRPELVRPSVARGKLYELVADYRRAPSARNPARARTTGRGYTRRWAARYV